MKAECTVGLKDVISIEIGALGDALGARLGAVVGKAKPLLIFIEWRRETLPDCPSPLSLTSLSPFLSHLSVTRFSLSLSVSP
jgi:hypothetical protein